MTARNGGFSEKIMLKQEAGVGWLFKESHPAPVFSQTVEAATASRMTSTTGFGTVTSGV
jgi:hypothetical protein